MEIFRETTRILEKNPVAAPAERDGEPTTTIDETIERMNLFQINFTSLRPILSGSRPPISSGYALDALTMLYAIALKVVASALCNGCSFVWAESPAPSIQEKNLIIKVSAGLDTLPC